MSLVYFVIYLTGFQQYASTVQSLYNTPDYNTDLDITVMLWLPYFWYHGNLLMIIGHFPIILL